MLSSGTKTIKITGKRTVEKGAESACRKHRRKITRKKWTMGGDNPKWRNLMEKKQNRSNSHNTNRDLFWGPVIKGDGRK